MTNRTRVVALLTMLVLMGGVVSASAAPAPSLSVSPSSGAPGTWVVASGGGFPSRATLTFAWDAAAAQAPTVQTRPNGSFSISLQLPQLAAGAHILRATAGGVSVSSVVQITVVQPSPSLTPAPTVSPSATALPTLSPTPTPAATATPTSGALAPSIGGCPTLPVDNIWNARIDSLPVSPFSTSYIASMGASVGLHPDFGTVWNGAPNGIPMVIVPSSQPLAPISFSYADESDPGPYPIPANAPIEGGASSSGDRHVLVVDSGACKLYELYSAYPQSDGSWTAGSGAVFPLTSDTLRPAGWTSADAAGLPILPGLVRYDEVTSGHIAHALRFTAAVTQRAYVWPARHFASSNTSTSVPPMGTRVRLKASVDISGFSPANQVILQALQTYGMLLADNGSNWYISGAPSSSWNDSDLAAMRQVVGSSFEVIDTTSLMLDPNSGQARAY